MTHFLKMIGLALIHVFLFVAVEASPLGETVFPYIRKNWLISMVIISIVITGAYRSLLK